MNLAEIRSAIAAIEITPDTVDELAERIAASPELLRSLGENYRKLDAGERIRPTLPNDMQFLYMLDRQVMNFVLFPELLPLQYAIGKVIGREFVASFLESDNLPDLMVENQPIFERHNYGICETIESSENRGVYRVRESADSYGLPNLGLKICIYECGTCAGGMEVKLNRPVTVTETHCVANGDPWCQFVIEVE